MENAIVIIVLAIVIGLAVAYIIKEKKKGAACIGCPAAGQCAHNRSDVSGCGCGSHSKTEYGCCGGHTESK